MADFYFDNICILYVVLLDAGSVTGAEKKAERESPHFFFSYPGFVICHMRLLFLLHICADVSQPLTKRRDSQKRFFIVMLKLIHPAVCSTMKEAACFIGYAL